MRACTTPLPAATQNHAPGAATAVALFAATLIWTPVHAQGSGSGPGPGGDGASSSWSLGIGVASGQTPYAGIRRETKAIPMIQFENKYVRVQGLGLEVKLPSLVLSDTQRLNVSLAGRQAMGGYEADDAPILAGMAERKSGLWVSAKAEWKTSLANVSADWTGDAAGHSKGQKFSLGISQPWRLGSQMMITPRLGMTWQDRKYNDYYFGVRDAEVRPGRAAYQANAGVNVEASLTGLYKLDRHHAVMLGASVTSLSKAIRNSPLVDRSTENRVFMAYLYRF